MPEDKKNAKDRIEEELSESNDEATQANSAIQEEFYSDDESSGPASSPVPYVANNTAPLSTADDEDKKK